MAQGVTMKGERRSGIEGQLCNLTQLRKDVPNWLIDERQIDCRLNEMRLKEDVLNKQTIVLQ